VRGGEGVVAVLRGGDLEAICGDGGVVGAADYRDAEAGDEGKARGVEGADCAGAYYEDVRGHGGLGVYVLSIGFVEMSIALAVSTSNRTGCPDWQTRSQDREAGAVVSCWRGRHLIDR
jgi:hypothetical protein